MTTLAIFIEPEGELALNLRKWKKIINNKLPCQPYCSHPPHSTLIHANINEESNAIETICDAVISFSSFQTKATKPDVFWEDAATGGGHTLIWRIKLTDEMSKLQSYIAESLRPHLNEYIAPEFVKNNILLKKSFDKYGFPFVGSHWIPHFTVASIMTTRDNYLIKSFLNQRNSYEMDVKEISCWRVDGDKHTCLRRCKLK